MLEKSPHVQIGETGIMALKNVFHLRTLLSTVDTSHSLIDWGKHLHPTPALGGQPSKAALDFLRANENMNADFMRHL